MSDQADKALAPVAVLPAAQSSDSTATPAVAAPVTGKVLKGRGSGLRPFPKGVSGNPGGRPKRELEKVRKAAREHGVEAIEKLVHLMRHGSDKVAFLAAEALLARGFGRPPLTVEAEGGGPIGAGPVGVIFLPSRGETATVHPDASEPNEPSDDGTEEGGADE